MDEEMLFFQEKNIYTYNFKEPAVFSGCIVE